MHFFYRRYRKAFLIAFLGVSTSRGAPTRVTTQTRYSAIAFCAGRTVFDFQRRFGTGLPFFENNSYQDTLGYTSRGQRRRSRGAVSGPVHTGCDLRARIRGILLAGQTRNVSENDDRKRRHFMCTHTHTHTSFRTPLFTVGNERARLPNENNKN